MPPKIIGHRPHSSPEKPQESVRSTVRRLASMFARKTSKPPMLRSENSKIMATPEKMRIICAASEYTTAFIPPWNE